MILPADERGIRYSHSLSICFPLPQLHEFQLTYLKIREYLMILSSSFVSSGHVIF